MIITAQKSMHEAKCSDCGKIATVPFKPAADKPVYCRDCFSKHRFRTENVEKNLNGGCKQMWARRRDNGQAKTGDVTASVFHWSYSVHDKTT